MDGTFDEYKLDTRKYLIGVPVAIFFIAAFLTAQYLGRKLQFNPLLGWSFAIGDMAYYPPWAVLQWHLDPLVANNIPALLKRAKAFIFIPTIFSFLITNYIIRKNAPKSSHGSAGWATKKMIEKMGLADADGVILGVNPYTKKLLMHDGPQHILLMAPTRSGKGVGVIIPTLLAWKHSVFVLDVKSENFAYTATFRKYVLHQKVIKFAPLSDDGSSARWNPLAEINLCTPEELNDVMSIVEILVNPSGEPSKGDPFWADSAATVLQGIILHLMYAHKQEEKPLPTISDIITILSGASGSLDEVFKKIKKYPHISIPEFYSKQNPLQEVYGEYIYDLTPYSTILGKRVKTLNELKVEMFAQSDKVDFSQEPWCYLLTHPKANEMASNMSTMADQTRSGVISTVMADLKQYQNPIIKMNTSTSDFCVKDLLDPEQALAFYLCIPPQQLPIVKPLCRMLINTILDKLIRDLDLPPVSEAAKARAPKKKKQRLLFMLDEFPQFGKFKTIETALAVCAGYGLKMCVICQDNNQLNNIYTKDNSILSNCHVRVYFTPNDNETMSMVSKQLGKKTITTASHSDGGGLFKGSNSFSQTSRELMTPDEVGQMDENKEIVFVAGRKPIYGDKLHYYKWKIFTEKCEDPPLYSDKGQHVINDYKSLFAFHEEESRERLRRKKEISELKAKNELVEYKKISMEQQDNVFDLSSLPESEEDYEKYEVQIKSPVAKPKDENEHRQPDSEDDEYAPGEEMQSGDGSSEQGSTSAPIIKVGNPENSADPEPEIYRSDYMKSKRKRIFRKRMMEQKERENGEQSGT